MTEDVIVAREGRVGLLRLNRPKAIHALTGPMCAAMIDALQAWRVSGAVDLVLLDHAEGRGFCAGGDIRIMAESGAGDGATARAFFRDEYRLNHLLFTYEKPIISFLDGITMGGGVGLGLPARYRVATENTRFAMPETGIGLFPDVGGGWYLSRLPHRVGQFIALTGARLDGAECCALGLATHFVPADALAQLKRGILDRPSAFETVLDETAVAPPPAKIADRIGMIERLFAADLFEEILAALEADGSAWALKELATLRAKAPLSCKIALRLLLEGASVPSFAEEMKREYAIAVRVVQTHDFIEGVRALIVDKDNAPKWNPANPADVTDAMVGTFFAPLPQEEEWSPLT